MVVENVKKTVFITDEAIFYYTYMPFRLKNVGTKFQQMVNNIFRVQINKNMEVYVDNLILKSKKMSDLQVDMHETFERVRAIGMQLNPKKCIFWVPSGNIWGSLFQSKDSKPTLPKSRLSSKCRSQKTRRASKSY